jgi:hypothetical protein
MKNGCKDATKFGDFTSRKLQTPQSGSEVIKTACVIDSDL